MKKHSLLLFLFFASKHILKRWDPFSFFFFFFATVCRDDSAINDATSTMNDQTFLFCHHSEEAELYHLFFGDRGRVAPSLSSWRGEDKAHHIVIILERGRRSWTIIVILETQRQSCIIVIILESAGVELHHHRYLGEVEAKLHRCHHLEEAEVELHHCDYLGEPDAKLPRRRHLGEKEAELHHPHHLEDEW